MSVPSTTRAYQLPELTSFDKLVIKEIPVTKPRANEVLVKVHAVSLQYRDLVIASGRYAAPSPPNLVPCSDMAGEIIALGEDVKTWKVGDRVCANFALDHIYGDNTPATQATALGGAIDGVLTEYRSFPAHSLVIIPNHLSYEEASTLPCAALTAYNSLYGPVPLKAGDYVLVLGTGGVSIHALQLAVAAGAIVIATSSSDEKLKIATKLGAKHVINYKQTPNWDEEVRKITGGQGVHHIIEVGGEGTLEKSSKSVRNGGWLHLIGFVSGIQFANILVPTIMKAIVLRGIQIGSVAQFQDMNRLLIANPEVTRPLIDKVFAFEDAKKAYAHLASQAHVGKVVIKVSKD